MRKFVLGVILGGLAVSVGYAITKQDAGTVMQAECRIVEAGHKIMNFANIVEGGFSVLDGASLDRENRILTTTEKGAMKNRFIALVEIQEAELAKVVAIKESLQ